jgi:hypothetical protein
MRFELGLTPSQQPIVAQTCCAMLISRNGAGGASYPPRRPSYFVRTPSTSSHSYSSTATPPSRQVRATRLDPTTTASAAAAEYLCMRQANSGNVSTRVLSALFLILAFAGRPSATEQLSPRRSPHAQQNCSRQLSQGDLRYCILHLENHKTILPKSLALLRSVAVFFFSLLTFRPTGFRLSNLHIQ